MSIYKPLTIQMGDRTFAGEWMEDGEVIHVRCAEGERSGKSSLWTKPASIAERLLLEILKESGQI